MSNTYAKIEKINSQSIHTTNMSLSLTAFVAPKDLVQLTITTISTLASQSGTGYISLNEEEIDQLIFALLERKHGLINATTDEQSKLIPEIKSI